MRSTWFYSRGRRADRAAAIIAHHDYASGASARLDTLTPAAGARHDDVTTASTDR